MNLLSIQRWLAFGLAVALFSEVGATLPVRGQESAKEEDGEKSKDPPLLKKKQIQRSIIDYADDPYDLLTVQWEDPDGKHKEETVKIFSLAKLPPSPKPDDKLRVRLVKLPLRQYDVEWKHIKKYVPYAELVYEEAKKLVQAGKYNEAYRYFDYLMRLPRPSTQIRRSVRDYVFANADAALKRKEYDYALGMFEELRRSNPSYRTKEVLQRIDSIADTFIRDAVTRKDYRTARGVLVRMLKQYSENDVTSLGAWRERLIREAEARKERAAQLLKENKFREAHEVGRDMFKIWPQLPGALELTMEIHRRHPMVVVGVGRLAARLDPRRIDDWAGRRVARIVDRPLLQFVGPGPEGGLYRCPLGSLSQSDDRRTLYLDLDVPPDPQNAVVTGYDVVRRMAQVADPTHPDYTPTWAALLDQLAVRDVFQVEMHLRRPHVLPECLLQVVLHPDAEHRPPGSPSEGPFVIDTKNENTMRLLNNPRFPFEVKKHVKEVVEQRFDDPDLAVSALERGDIDVLDYVYPADVPRLRANDQLVVGRYNSPTVHFLVANPNRPFPGRALFRRAILYGINRREILSRDIQGQYELDGYRVITGPFPTGTSEFDPLSYAYDSRLRERPYNPALAAVLRVMAEKELKEIARRRRQPEPKYEGITICHADDPLARIACQSIAQYLNIIGMECRVKQLPAGVIRPQDDDWDFFYVQAAVWEPLVDARRLLGPHGIGGTNDNYVMMALRNLDQAKNWRQVRVRLHELHRIVYEQLTVIPLWQTVDYFAHHVGVENVPDVPVLLYDTVEQWHVIPRVPRD